MPVITPLSSLDTMSISADAVIIFGGTFDPFHAGHLSILNSIKSLFPKVLIAPTQSNPWKQSPTSLSIRLKLIRMILKTEKIPFNDLVNLQLKPGINLTDHGYNFSIELLQWLEDNGQRNNYWAIGEDSIESIKNWKEFSDLNTTFVVCPIILNTHSAMQRAGEMPVHPAIKSYVIKNNLY